MKSIEKYCQSKFLFALYGNSPADSKPITNEKARKYKYITSKQNEAGGKTAGKAHPAANWEVWKNEKY